jgi:hypothetical protein
MSRRRITRRHAVLGPGDLFDPFEKHDFSFDMCFLCGQRLSAAIRSEEHVFPQWLLHRFDLHNKDLNLLNGTAIPYRQLTIPCCRVCNNEHLSAIESDVRDVIEERKPIGALDEKTLYLWTSKIFYGLLYREVLLPMDRRNRAAGPIITIDPIRTYRTLHVFLQAARLDIDFHCFDARFPASVFAFKVQQPKTMEARFDFKDDIRTAALYLRLGRVGILASFDAGAQACEWRHLYRKYHRYRLHPVQLEELGAAMFYKASLFDRVPKLVISTNPRQGYRIMVMPLAGLSLKPVFRKWETPVFAKYLSAFTDMPLDHLAPDGGRRIMTFMTWPDSKRFKAIDLRRHPWRGVP